MIYAAVTVYHLRQHLYGALSASDARARHLYSSGGLTALPLWQRIVYFSYSTLTTLGYDDIILCSAWTRFLAGLEAMLGLLYLAVISGRSIGQSQLKAS